MAEIVSRQVAKLNAGNKLAPHEAGGKVRSVVITSPATAAWADGDTLASGVRLPTGIRFLSMSYASHEDFTTSVVLDVGIRDFDTKTAIDADGICSGVSIAAAGRSVLNNGVFVAAGAEYTTTAESEVYATIRGANPTDNKQIRIEVFYVSPD